MGVNRIGKEQTTAAAAQPDGTREIEFDIGDYVAPPRTITDVTALLEQHQQTNLAYPVYTHTH